MKTGPSAPSCSPDADASWSQRSDVTQNVCWRGSHMAYETETGLDNPSFPFNIISKIIQKGSFYILGSGEDVKATDGFGELE